VLLPGAFVLFYRSPHVKATCERRDPSVPWTDRCPAPVLAAALLSGATSLGCLLAALGYRVFLFFGLRTGGPALLAGLLLAALYAASAVLLYRQHPLGLRLAAATAALVSASGAWSVAGLDPAALYQAIGYSREWAERMAPAEAGVRALVLAGGPIWLGFLWWVRRSAAQTTTRSRPPFLA
jgi:hypothetical protein